MNSEENCLQLDKELAELLGWKIVTERLISFPNVGIVYKHCFISGINPNYPYGDNFELPRWTQSDAEAFRLMVEYNVELDMYDTFVSDFRTGPNYYYKDFPDKQSAVRFAIVQAVIHKLKGN